MALPIIKEPISMLYASEMLVLKEFRVHLGEEIINDVVDAAFGQSASSKNLESLELVAHSFDGYAELLGMVSEPRYAHLRSCSIKMNYYRCLTNDSNSVCLLLYPPSKVK